MDKEKEIETARLFCQQNDKCCKKIKGDCNAVQIVEILQKEGYGNIEQAVREFAEKLKKEFFFMRATANKEAIYRFSDSQLDDLIKELYPDDTV